MIIFILMYEYFTSIAYFMFFEDLIYVRVWKIHFILERHLGYIIYYFILFWHKIIISEQGKGIMIPRYIFLPNTNINRGFNSIANGKDFE